MKRSFWSKAAGATGKTLACTALTALSAVLLFVVCSEKSNTVAPPADPCVANPQSSPTCPGYVPPTDQCAANPTAPGCPQDPCVLNPQSSPTCPGYVDPSCPATTPGCPGYVDPGCPPTTPGCPGYVDPGCPPTTPGCPGYVEPCPSTQPGCPGYVDPSCPATTPGCPGYVDPCPSTQPGCPGYVDPCPSTQPGCPGYVPPAGDTKYCYWAPNQYNEYAGSCVAIGDAYCDPGASCTEAECTTASGVVKTTSNCDGLPLTGDPCELDPTPACPNYCDVVPTAAVCQPPTSKKWCYWAPNSYNDNKESCAEIGASTCEEASCKNEHGCEQSSGEVKTVANCGIVSPITGITTDSNANKTCLMSSKAMYCQYVTGCYEINVTYGEPPGSTCQELADHCYQTGKIFTGVTNVNADNDYGAGVTCNGTAYAP